MLEIPERGLDNAAVKEKRNRLACSPFLTCSTSGGRPGVSRVGGSLGKHHKQGLPMGRRRIHLEPPIEWMFRANATLVPCTSKKEVDESEGL